MKLTDVVDRINGNVDRFNTDLEYYIGGEHFDSEELIISKRGTIKDNLGKLGFKFHFAFQDRDVIFMARNPHLRKAGMVRFSGLCSDASYILRSKNEKVISQDFLAVMLQSDRFWDYCESHKVGSVNFANNWSTIANYEFQLPDPKFQRELADKVWAAYEVKQSYLKMIDATQEMVKAQFVEMFENQTECPKDLLKEHVKEMFIGPFGSALKNECFVEDDTRFCVVYEQKHAIDKDITIPFRYVNEDKYNELKRFTITPGDIIVSCRGTVGEVFLIPQNAPIGIMHPSIMKIRLNEGYMPEFFIYALTKYMKERERLNIGTGIKMAIKATELENEYFPVPTLEAQRCFVDIVHQADKSISELRKSVDAIDKVIKSLINENL